MKLYTEDQLKEAFHCGRLYQGRQGDTNIYHLIDKLTPIELPSEEIQVESENYALSKHPNPAMVTFRKYCSDDFMHGVKCVLNKIQGGNK
jgi:hypothetical protein